MTGDPTGGDAPDVLVRADAGTNIGSGHVIRCLTLAERLRHRGARIVFATRSNFRSHTERIAASGCEILQLTEGGQIPARGRRTWPCGVQQEDAAAVRDAVGSHRFDAVIVDHYGLAEEWELVIREITDRLIAVDDLANRPHTADVLVDHNWYGPETGDRYRELVPPGSLQLLGPRYALLQRSYASLRPVAHRHDGPLRRVLVSFGGTDPTGETLKVLRALTSSDLVGLKADVVLGSALAVTDEIEAAVASRSDTRLHVELPTLADLLAQADLAVGASGAATWERICLRVPALVTTSRDDQSGVTRALASEGMTTWIGLAGATTVDDYQRHLRECLERPPPLPPPVVDGLGADRVAEAVLPSDEKGGGLRVRAATELDAPVFMGVDRGSPATEPKLLEGPGTWQEEGARFQEELHSGTHTLLVVELNGVPIGRVRAEAADGKVRASFALDDVVGHRGYGPHVAHILSVGRWDPSNGLAFTVPEAGHESRPSSSEHVRSAHGSIELSMSSTGGSS